MRRILAICAGAAVLLWTVPLMLSGCSGTEARGSLTVTAPSLDPGTILAIATEPQPLQFRPVQQAPVDEGHIVRFVNMEPGQYRLVVYRNGSPAEFSPIVPVVPGENRVVYTPEKL